MSKLSSRFRQLINGLRYLARGDLSGLLRRVQWYGREYSGAKLRKRLASGDGVAWGIICTPHTLFIANALSKRLADHGIGSEIVTGPMETFHHDFYVVLCAQMFKRLPPANKRAIFQLEQSVSSRWFTPEYIESLKDSFAVIEYSLTNVQFLLEKGIGYPKVHYIPIGACVAERSTPSAPKKYDFVFYGDSFSSERRRNFLEKLQEKYHVKICNDAFGEEMYAIIREAKAVINIHYYENALLEMPRICECISLGVPVLSEGTADQSEYPELAGAVRFFDEGSPDGMMEAAAEMLSDIEAMAETVRDSTATSASRFNFMMDRFLTAIGVIPADAILAAPPYVPHESRFFALSLPETIGRRTAIAQTLPNGCVLFDGIRNNLGWVGCGSSFKALSRYALSRNLERLIVIEDDVDLPSGFDGVLSEIEAYLDARQSSWDIFSGMMADVHPSARVLSVEKVGARTYVTIDKMTSTVFNIYNRSALDRISQWNPLDTDAVSNTIDRYLERQDSLRIVVALPFVAGHKEDATSTLWGFENNRYTPMIAEAQQRIEQLAGVWLRENSMPAGERQ